MFDAYRKVIGLIARRPWVALLATVLVTISAIFFARDLRLDGDLGRLLPENARSVQGLRHLERSYGDQIGRLTVVIQHDDQATGRKYAQELALAIEDRVDGVNRVVVKNPVSELKDQRLLFLDLEDLETIDKRLRKRIRWEKQRANPLFASLKKREPPSVDFSDIEASYKDRGGVNANTSEYYEDPETGEILVFIHPEFPASELNKTKQLVADVEAVAGPLLRGQDWALTGRYAKRIEQQSLMTQDIVSATPLALLFLILFLLVYFRSFVSVVQTLTPLLIGTVIGIAFAQIVFGSLNILTGFLGAVLMGLGVDYGIHLVSKYRDVMATESLSPQEAWFRTFQTTGKASIYSGLTTMLALGSLAVSSFRAFYEFGIIAMAGIVFVLAAYAIVLPTLIFLGRPDARPRASFATVLGEKIQARLEMMSASERRGQLRATVVVTAFLGLMGASVAVLGGPHVSFDRSFDSLSISDTKTNRLDQRVNEILGESQTPSVVLVEDAQHERAVVSELEARKADPTNPGHHTIGNILSLDRLLPKDQTAKLALLEKLIEKIDSVPEKSQTDALKDFAQEIRTTVAKGPLTKENLPKSIAVPFSRVDSDDASVVLVMPAVDLNDATANRAFAKVLRDLPSNIPGQRIDAIGGVQLLTDIMELVLEDTKLMLMLTIFGLVLVSLIAFGFTFYAPRLLLFIVVGAGAAVGALGLAHQPFNFINILIVPIWLGLGVDAAFHILIHIREEPRNFATHVSTAVSVAAAFMTSMIGFGAMMMSHHTGLNSLGVFAVVGLGSLLLLSIGLAAHLASRQQIFDP